MSIRHLLQSLLVRQYLALAKEWDAKYPHDWLLWEAGGAKTPLETTNLMTTQAPSGQPAAPASATDSLCFALTSPTGRVTVGRAVDNDIVIPDGTVSRQHLVLEQAGGRWTAIALPASRATRFTVQSAPVAEDSPIPLSSGDRITLGNVTLTYLTAAQLKAKVEAEAKRFSEP